VRDPKVTVTAAVELESYLWTTEPARHSTSLHVTFAAVIRFAGLEIEEPRLRTADQQAQQCQAHNYRLRIKKIKHDEKTKLNNSQINYRI
jgi:hypothetical protein